jgi:hypothetical protein
MAPLFALQFFNFYFTFFMGEGLCCAMFSHSCCCWRSTNQWIRWRKTTLSTPRNSALFVGIRPQQGRKTDGRSDLRTDFLYERYVKGEMPTTIISPPILRTTGNAWSDRKHTLRAFDLALQRYQLFEVLGEK